MGKNKVIIVTHEYYIGAAQYLFNYLNDLNSNVSFLAHPLLGEEDSYILKKNKKKKVATNSKNFLHKYINQIYQSLKILRSEKCDIFIGVNCFNTFIGIIYKLFFKQNLKIFYYTIDYVPKRFGNNFILNFTYSFLDVISYLSSNYNWVVSKRISNAPLRKIFCLNKKIIVTPIGIKNIKISNFNKLIKKRFTKKSILFLGHLYNKQGLELLSKISIDHDIKLGIIGDGPFYKYLKNLSRNYKNIKLYGKITDPKKQFEISKNYSIGYCVYDDKEISFTNYADPTKPKEYIRFGLPIIISNFLEFSILTKKYNFGLSSKYEYKVIYNDILKILSNINTYKSLSINAYQFSENLKWELIFEKTLKQSNIYELL